MIGACEDVMKGEPSFTAEGIVDCSASTENSMTTSQKTELLYHPEILILAVYLRNKYLPCYLSQEHKKHEFEKHTLASIYNHLDVGMPMSKNRCVMKEIVA